MAAIAYWYSIGFPSAAKRLLSSLTKEDAKEVDSMLRETNASQIASIEAMRANQSLGKGFKYVNRKDDGKYIG